MARSLNKLSARTVATAKVKGRYGDGGGLYLRIDDTGKRWVIRYTFEGRSREMGAGSASDVPLSRAREIAASIRAKVAAGADPISDRSVPLSPALKAPPTFAEIASVYMADRESHWRNAAHPPAMAPDPGDASRAAVAPAGGRCRHRRYPGGAPSDVDHEGRDGAPVARPH